MHASSISGWAFGTSPGQQNRSAASQATPLKAQTASINFDQCALEENFSTADGAFLRRSLSVYDTQSGMWRQTWVDSTGGYLLVSGEFDGERMELRTKPLAREDETVIQRMVFRDIEPSSMKWDWQGSRDGGGTWNDLWNISNQRRS